MITSRIYINKMKPIQYLIKEDTSKLGILKLNPDSEGLKD